MYMPQLPPLLFLPTHRRRTTGASTPRQRCSSATTTTSALFSADACCRAWTLTSGQHTCALSARYVCKQAPRMYTTYVHHVCQHLQHRSMMSGMATRRWRSNRHLTLHSTNWARTTTQASCGQTTWHFCRVPSRARLHSRRSFQLRALLGRKKRTVWQSSGMQSLVLLLHVVSTMSSLLQ